MNTISSVYSWLLIAVNLMCGLAHAQTAAPPRATNATAAKPVLAREFRFDGGGFLDFTRKLAEQFGSNFLDVLEVRGEEAYRLQIPKMRHTYLRLPAEDWSSVLKLFNQISDEGNGFLGKWIFTPPNAGWVVGGQLPQTLIFMPPRPVTGDAAAIQVRAFSIRGIPREALGKLTEIIEQESQRLQMDIETGRLPAGRDLFLAQGRLSLHEGSNVLVAAGGRTYVELVKSVVDAFLINYPFLSSPPQKQQ